MKVVWNPNRKGVNAEIHNDGLTVTVVPSTYDNIVTTNVSKSSGVHYCEFELLENKTSIVGIYKEPINTAGNYSQVNNWGYYAYGPYIYHNGQSLRYGTGYNVGDTVGILLDLDNMKVGFYKNGEYQGDAYTDLPKGEYGIMVTNAATVYGIKYTARFNKDSFKYPVPENALPYEIFSSYLIESNSNLYSIQDKFYDIKTNEYTTCTKDFINSGFENIIDLTSVKLSNSIAGISETSSDNKKISKFNLGCNMKSIVYSGSESNYYILHKEDGYYSIVDNVVTKTDIVELTSDNIINKGFVDLSSLDNIDYGEFELICYNTNEVDVELNFVLKTSFRPIDKFNHDIQLLKYIE